MRIYEPVALGARLRKCRRDLDMSQAQVAKKLGVSQRHISTLEMGEFHTLNMQLLDALATLFGTQVEVLLYGKQAVLLTTESR